MGLEIVIVWFALSVVAGIVAHSRGRSGFGYFMLSLLLSPLVGLILVALLPAEVQVPKAGDGVHRKCPMCAELVKLEALRCRHCGGELVPAAPGSPTAEDHEAAAAQYAADAEAARHAARGRSIGYYFGEIARDIFGGHKP